MKKANIERLLISELKSILGAEEQIIKALPNIIKAAESPELKKAFRVHLEETIQQVSRIEEIFSILDLSEESEPCKAMSELIKECEEVIRTYTKSAIRDASLISKAQHVEHYEISVYGTLKTFAEELKLEKVAKILKESLDEEINTDKILTRIAEGGFLTTGINQKANQE